MVDPRADVDGARVAALDWLDDTLGKIAGVIAKGGATRSEVAALRAQSPPPLTVHTPISPSLHADLMWMRDQIVANQRRLTPSDPPEWHALWSYGLTIIDTALSGCVRRAQVQEFMAAIAQVTAERQSRSDRRFDAERNAWWPLFERLAAEARD